MRVKRNDFPKITFLFALFYLFLYPVIAQPVYQYSLVKQRQLTLIKQKQESERLLTVEQSRNILRDLVLVREQHAHEVDDLNTQISIRDKRMTDMFTKARGKVKKSEVIDNNSQTS